MERKKLSIEYCKLTAVVLTLFLFLFSGCSVLKRILPDVNDKCYKKNNKIIMLSLGEDFNKFTGGPLDVFEKDPLCWNSVEKEKYDKFFEEGSYTIAYLRLSKRIIEIFESLTKEAANDPNSDFVTIGVAIYPFIKDVAPKIENLINISDNLMQEAKNDFGGFFQMLQLKETTITLQNIRSELNSTAKELPDIISKLEAIILIKQKNFLKVETIKPEEFEEKKVEKTEKAEIFVESFANTVEKKELPTEKKETVVEKVEQKKIVEKKLDLKSIIPLNANQYKSTVSINYFYSIRFSSNKNFEYAKLNIDRFKTEGLFVFMKEITNKRGLWYVLFTGKYENRQTAVKDAEKLKKKGLIGKDYKIQKINRLTFEILF